MFPTPAVPIDSLGAGTSFADSTVCMQNLFEVRLVFLSGVKQKKTFTSCVKVIPRCIICILCEHLLIDSSISRFGWN